MSDSTADRIDPNVKASPFQRTPSDQYITDTMTKALTDFVRIGDPNGATVRWPPVNPMAPRPSYLSVKVGEN